MALCHIYHYSTFPVVCVVFHHNSPFLFHRPQWTWWDPASASSLSPYSVFTLSHSGIALAFTCQCSFFPFVRYLRIANSIMMTRFCDLKGYNYHTPSVWSTFHWHCAFTVTTNACSWCLPPASLLLPLDVLIFFFFWMSLTLCSDERLHQCAFVQRHPG